MDLKLLKNIDLAQTERVGHDRDGRDMLKTIVGRPKSGSKDFGAGGTSVRNSHHMFNSPPRTRIMTFRKENRRSMFAQTEKKLPRNRGTSPEIYQKKIKEHRHNTEHLKRTPYLTKWVDLSQKYGFGYKLSNGCYGVLYNDNTSMVNYKNTLIYIWKEGDTEMRAEYTTDTYPMDAKLKCMNYVKEYLDKEPEEEIIPMPWNGKYN